MCKWGTDKEVKVIKPLDSSRRTEIKVDSCLATLIQILNDYGIETLASCCGHGKTVKSYIKISAKNILLTPFGDEFAVSLMFPYQGKKK